MCSSDLKINFLREVFVAPAIKFPPVLTTFTWLMDLDFRTSKSSLNLSVISFGEAFRLAPGFGLLEIKEVCPDATSRPSTNPSNKADVAINLLNIAKD